MLQRWLPGVDDEPERPLQRPDEAAHGRMHADGSSEALDRDPGPPIPVTYALRGCAQFLREVSGGLGRLAPEHRVAAVSRIGRSWCDPLDAHRIEAIERLPAELGTSPESVAWALDATFESWTHEVLQSWLGGVTHTTHAGLTGHVWAGNVFTAGLPPVAASLLAGVPALIKAPGRLPTFAALFARSVAHHAPELGPCVGAAGWGRHNAAATAALLTADVVFAFGDDASLDALDVASPSPVRRFGHRYSVAIASAMPSQMALTRLTEDLLAYDGAGCLTPRWLFMEGSLNAAVAVAKRAAPLLAAGAKALPGVPLEPGPGAARATFLAAAAFEGWSDSGAGWAAAATTWDPTLVAPSRCLYVVAVPSLDQLPTLLSPLGPRLQGVALVGMDALGDDLLDALRALGVSRVVPAGLLQRPPIHWIHDDVDPFALD